MFAPGSLDDRGDRGSMAGNPWAVGRAAMRGSAERVTALLASHPEHVNARGTVIAIP